MTHKFPPVSESEVEHLIVQVYESMPDADQSRLSTIESRLLLHAKRTRTQKSLNKIPWWIVLLLAGGFASAAWWIGDMIVSKQQPEIIEKQLQGNGKMNESGPGVVDDDQKTEAGESNNTGYRDNDSPIIYQRESY